ncbi:MAG: radical SAM protein [Candidatus Sericytochromatia bacterium]|nr:radical SAM protein [Candidatus Sericytochromatia bacterium]
MSRILIVNPPTPPGPWYFQKDRAAGLGTAAPLRPKASRPAPLAPHDLAQIAGYALDAGWQVEVFDPVALHLDAAGSLAALPATAPDVVAVRLALFSLEQDLVFADAVKARFPASQVILWGNVIHFTVKDWAGRSRADSVCFGEPEAVLLPFLRGTDTKGLIPLTEIGPTWRTGWQNVKELVDVPLPAWHLLPLARYAPDGDLSQLVLHLQTSLGCSVACSMCPYFVLQGRYRQHTLARVLAEMRYLRSLGVMHVQFRDANITERPELPRALAEALIAEPLGLTFTMETALENVPPDDLRLYHRAGLRGLITGIESADPATLALINQNPEWSAPISANLALCAALGIDVTTMYIVGFPHDSWASIGETIALAKTHRSRFYSVSVMTPYHGTPYRSQALANGFVTTDAPYRAYTGFSAMGGTHSLTADEVDAAYRAARATLELHSRWHFPPAGLVPQVSHWLRFAWLAATTAPARLSARWRARLAPVNALVSHAG